MHLAGPYVVAHQGGWDEILMFVIPIALAFGAIRLIERRNRGRDEEDQSEPESQ
jgi:hypothetical protein